MSEMHKSVRRWRDSSSNEDEVPQPTPTERKMSWQRLKTLLERTFPGVRVYIWDNWYYYMSHEEWGAALEDVLFGMPDYTASRFDCENFATLCTCRVSSKYLVNSMGIAIGKHNGHAHGFNVFLSEVDGEPQLFLLEPQTGMVMPPSEPEGYEVDYVIVG